SHRHLVGIADDASLGSAEWDIHYRTLPSHPARERSDLVESDVGSVTDAAFRGAAGNRMLHAKSGEDLELAIVHRDRDMNNELAVRILQNFPQAFIEIEFLSGEVEARRLRLPGIDLLFEGNSFHRVSDNDHDASWPMKGLGPEANLQILVTARRVSKQRTWSGVRTTGNLAHLSGTPQVSQMLLRTWGTSLSGLELCNGCLRHRG